MRKVKCPRCSAIITARGDVVKCVRCGLKGAVEAPPPIAPSKSAAGDQAKGAKGEKDPFVITLDLRKISPKHWGRGAKVFAVLFLLAGAFFLGGMAGVAFEKARSEISEDLDRGESLLGGGSTDANASGPADGADAVDDTADDTADDPADDPISDGSTDTTDTNTSDDGQDNQTTDPPDDPDPGDGGDPVGEPDPIKLSGTGDDTTDAFGTDFPLLRFDMDYWGDQFFGVKVCQAGTSCAPSDGRVAYLTAEDPGVYSGSRLVVAPAGDYYLKVDAGDGAWDIAVLQPRPDEGTGLPVARSGNGDDVRGPFEFEAAHDVRVEASGIGQVAIKAYTLAGEAVQGCSFTTYLGQGETYDETKTCSVPSSSLVYFDIVAPDKDSGQSWSITIDG